MADPLGKLRADSQVWSDEHLVEQYNLGPTAFATQAAWNIIQTEYEHRGLHVTAADVDGGSHQPRTTGEPLQDHTSYAVNRLSEGSSYLQVTSGLIERGLVESEAHQLVRRLAEARRDTARQSAKQGFVWCAGGMAITAATFLTAAPGETFVLAWGAIAFGAFQAWRGWDVALRPLPEPGAAVLAPVMGTQPASVAEASDHSQLPSKADQSVSQEAAPDMEISRAGISLGTKLFLLGVSLYVILRIAWVVMKEGV